MALDQDRNRMLAALPEWPVGAESQDLAAAPGLPRDAAERRLLRCAGYGLVARPRGSGSGATVITDRGRDCPARPGL